MLVAGGYRIVKTFVLSQLVGVELAKDGEIEEVVPGKAFFVRRETILRSPVTGTVTVTLEEGARARADAEVARLSDAEETQQAQARVNQLEADLTAFNEANQGEENTLTEKIASLRTEAEAKAVELRSACLEGDAEGIDQLSADLTDLGRQEREASARLAAIRKDRAAIEESLATARAALAQTVFPVVAPEPGIVSYCLDGLEETLTPDKIGQFSTKQLLTATRRAVLTSDQSKVKAQDPVARIVWDGEAYVSVIVTNGQADTLSAVPEVTLRFAAFEGRREIPASLYHVGEREKSGYCLVTYRTSGILDGMVSARQAQAEVVTHVYKGTVVPAKAVVRRGGQDGVFVVDVSVCRFRPVTVLGGNGSEVVVDDLAPGTQIVTTPWLVDEGTRIG